MSSENYTIADQNAVYFLTFTVTDWIDIFTRSCYKIVIVDSLNYCIANKGELRKTYARLNHKKDKDEEANQAKAE